MVLSKMVASYDQRCTETMEFSISNVQFRFWKNYAKRSFEQLTLGEKNVVLLLLFNLYNKTRKESKLFLLKQFQLTPTISIYKLN